MAVAGAYGMLRPGAHDSTAVGASLITDPDGIARTTAACPMARWYNVEEVMRTVRALQTIDARNVFTSEERHPGNRVIETAPAISHEGALAPDWFYQTIEPEFDK